MKIFLIIIFLLNIPSVYAQSVQEYLSTGNDDLKLGSLDKAIEDYTKAIDLNPNFSKAYNNRGVAYAQEGSLPQAIADFTMAIACNPKDAEAYNNRGLAYTKQGNVAQAISDYTRAIESNAFYTKAYNNRELSYFKLKEYDKAWSDVHTVQAIGGGIDPAFIEDLKKASGQDQ